MDGGGGGSNAAGGLLMAFGGGDHNNTSSMRMMMLPPSSSSSSSPCQNINGGGGGGGGGALFYHNLHHHHHHHHQDSQVTNRHGSTDISAGATPPTVIMKNSNTHTNTATGCYFLDENNNSNNVNDDGNLSWSVKAKIMSHPHYPRLLSAYLSCQKIGAPPEVVARLEEACSASVATMARAAAGASGSGGGGGGMIIGQDPALDQFMEAYCEMLTKYEQELSKPFKEAMIFLSRIESQFKALSIASQDSACGEVMDRNGSSEEEFDVNNNLIDPQAEERELKGQLLRKYSGYLGSLKQEFMKKRKKGKLPKEARQQLLDWWSRHYKWPYPSEAQKLALAESTGLDQKQINNWFINQRKRHWKPSEDMQFVVMDAAHPHYFLDNVMGNPYPMDISPALL